MSSIPEELLKTKWIKEWHDPNVLDYIRTGNPTALQKIPQLADQGLWVISKALPAPPDWTPEADHVLQLAVNFKLPILISSWLSQFCAYHESDWEHFDAALDILRRNGVDQAWIDSCLIDSPLIDYKTSQPTKSGLLLIGYDDRHLMALLNRYRTRIIPTTCLDQFATVLASQDPARLDALLNDPKAYNRREPDWTMILPANPDRYHEQAKAAYEKKADHNPFLVFAIMKAQPELYREWAIDELRKICGACPGQYTSRQAIQYLLEIDAPGTFEMVHAWMADAGPDSSQDPAFQREIIIKTYRERYPDRVQPAIEAMARGNKSEMVMAGLRLWKAEGIGDGTERYFEGIRRLLMSSEYPAVIHGLKEAAIDPDAFASDLWAFMEHKSAPIRSAAIRTLSALGFSSLKDKGEKLLHSKKADLRLAAVILFQRNGAPETQALLKERLDIEESEAVRDAILLALDAAGGITFSPEERAARMAKTIAAAKGGPPASVDPAVLDPATLVLARRDGTRLSPEEVLYLLLRQSRCAEMRADIEARPLLESLDRAVCALAALRMLEGFLASGQDNVDRWIIALSALCGDDRLVPPLHKAILTWAENARGKLAEYATGALALLGTDAALTVLESLTVRFRSKCKNIGQAAGDAFLAAAEARGVSVEELGDRVVPWLGFEPGVRKQITAGSKTWEAWVGPDFKPVYRETGTSKKLTKLPASAGTAILEEQKILTANLKEAAKAQLLRMETLLVRQFHWPADRWRELHLSHPLLRPFAEQLIWRHHPENGTEPSLTFRSLGDGGLTDAKGDAFELPPTGTVSLLHPLDLTETEKEEWSAHLDDYSIIPPFPQLERPVHRCPESETAAKFLRTVKDTELNAMTFRGRAEKLGWARGSVCDAGCVTAYRKVFSGTAVEAFLPLEGLYVGMGANDSITLGEICFVASGSVKTGSYVYDEPTGPDDPRLIALGSVPAVPFSEVMADLYKITGKSPDGPAALETVS